MGGAVHPTHRKNRRRPALKGAVRIKFRIGDNAKVVTMTRSCKPVPTAEEWSEF